MTDVPDKVSGASEAIPGAVASHGDATVAVGESTAADEPARKRARPASVREVILQAARATSSADDCALTKAVLDLTESAGNSQLLPSPMVPQSSAAECPAPPDGQSAETAAHAYDSARLAAAQQWGTKLYAQIPTQLRRMVPYTQGESSKIPRSRRQQVMTRLVGQHLALLLLEAGQALEQGLPPDPRCSEFVEAAFEAAIAQERHLAQKTSSAQVYQNLAAREKPRSVAARTEQAIGMCSRASLASPQRPNMTN